MEASSAHSKPSLVFANLHPTPYAPSMHRKVAALQLQPRRGEGVPQQFILRTALLLQHAASTGLTQLPVARVVAV
jgi:hypothetical protein